MTSINTYTSEVVQGSKVRKTHQQRRYKQQFPNRNNVYCSLQGLSTCEVLDNEIIIGRIEFSGLS